MQQPECGGSEESGESLAVDVRSCKGMGGMGRRKSGGKGFIYIQPMKSGVDVTKGERVTWTARRVTRNVTAVLDRGIPRSVLWIETFLGVSACWYIE